MTGLFMHRIADDDPNDWTMPIAVFDRLVGWLQQHVDLVSVEEAQRRIREGNSSRLAVHLSFDDGYADNCLHAVPSLLSKKIPFTYYVTTQNVRNGKPFPHDLKRGRPLAPNSIEEICAMADAGVEIGVHTRTHPDLGTFRRRSEIELEVRGAREDLAQWIGKQPRYFAFPFGLHHNLNSRVIQYLCDEAFSGFCSAYGGYNVPKDNAFHLRRFHADALLSRVRNWLTLDPRWLFAPPEYEYVPFVRPEDAAGVSHDSMQVDPSQ